VRTCAHNEGVVHVADGSGPFHAEIVLLSVIRALFAEVRTTVTQLHATAVVEH
jgi:hypothetical protein